jgi:hypothetical protein
MAECRIATLLKVYVDRTVPRFDDPGDPTKPPCHFPAQRFDLKVRTLVLDRSEHLGHLPPIEPVSLSGSTHALGGVVAVAALPHTDLPAAVPQPEFLKRFWQKAVFTQS